MKLFKAYVLVMLLIFCVSTGAAVVHYFPDIMWGVYTNALFIFTGGCLLTCAVLASNITDEEWADRIERDKREDDGFMADLIARQHWNPEAEYSQGAVALIYGKYYHAVKDNRGVSPLDKDQDCWTLVEKDVNE